MNYADELWNLTNINDRNIKYAIILISNFYKNFRLQGDAFRDYGNAMVGPTAKDTRTNTIARKIAGITSICARRRSGASRKRCVATELPIALTGKTRSYATVP